MKTYYIPIQSFLKPFETARQIGSGGSGSSFPPLYIDASSPDEASENSAQQRAVHGKGEFNHPHLIATIKQKVHRTHKRNTHIRKWFPHVRSMRGLLYPLSAHFKIEHWIWMLRHAAKMTLRAICQCPRFLISFEKFSRGYWSCWLATGQLAQLATRSIKGFQQIVISAQLQLILQLTPKMVSSCFVTLSTAKSWK